MGCMSSKEDSAASREDSPTYDSERPLIAPADGSGRLIGYEGGVAVSINSDEVDDNFESRNGLHLSETRVGGSPYFRGVSGPHPVNTGNGQHLINSLGDSYNQTGSSLLASSVPQGGVKSPRGKEVMNHLSRAYEWRTRFDSPSQEFLSLMDRLYMECQVHLSNLSSKGDPESKSEADAIVQEMVTVRNGWGTKLLPNHICNAFVRERIPHTVDSRQFRIDCAQFFEPVPFYGAQQTDNPGELMKLYRFSVYDLTRNEVVLRYYLERSNVTQLYHVLCFTCDNYRGQVYPYGSEVPSYWEVRHHMLEDLRTRLKSPAAPNLISTNFPTTQGGPVIIQIP